MKTDSIDFCLRVSAAHASLAFKLDDELGTYHGLSLHDFMLLRLLAQAEGGQLPLRALMRPLGATLSALTRQVMPLEKTGHVQRESAGGRRDLVLRPSGRRVLNEALGTAEQVCAEALHALSPAARRALGDALDALTLSEALAV